MDGAEDSLETPCEDEKDGSSSPGSSLSSSLDFRRQMRPPNKKQYDEKMEEVMRTIRATETDMKSLGSSESLLGQLRDIRSEREATINKRKKYDNDLRTLNQEITKKMGLLSRTESNLHYKNEVKIDDAIRKMECQLKTQNFRLADEKRIVAEIDKLKRSKKVLGEYLVQKKEVDKLRESQRRMRAERETLYRIVTTLNKKDEEKKKSIKERKDKVETYKKELDQLYTKKRELFAEFKQNESDYQRHQNERRHRLRKESFKKKEERKAKEENIQKEMIEYAAQCEPFEDQLNMCNALVSYLQKMNPGQEVVDGMLPSPRDEKPERPLGGSFGPADSLDDGKFVLLKKSEESDNDYTIANKPRRRSKKGRKLSVTKPIAHTPQIISQFSSLTLTPPSYMCEVAASIEQLQARKKYYEEQPGIPRPPLGSLSGSFSSSGSFSGSLDSPLRERVTTWGFVPPSIAENQTPSDAGASAESGFHDMSRQASKTESSNSAPDSAPGELIMEDLFAQCMQSAESETSRSSSDTITMEEQLDNGSNIKEDKTCDTNIASTEHSLGNSDYNSDEQCCANNDSSVFVETKAKLQIEDFLREGNQYDTAVFMSPTYDDDFPAIQPDNIGGGVISDHFSDKPICDAVINKPNVDSGSVSEPTPDVSATSHMPGNNQRDISDRNLGGHIVDINIKTELSNQSTLPNIVAGTTNKTHLQTGSIGVHSNPSNIDNTKNLSIPSTEISDNENVSKSILDNTKNLSKPSSELPGDDENVSKYEEVTHL